VARAAQRERNESSTANRIAARRRETTSERSVERAPKGKSKSAKAGKAGKAGRASGIARLFKLAVLVVAFLCIGFFVVLVVDVGASLVGSVKLGQDTTVAGLWEKVIARVLDEDVPRPPVEKPRPVAPAKPRVRATAPAVDRAPVQAARPEDDAKHVDVDSRTDPEVERAKQRLDEILGRL
jgi:hypothetical protein